MGASGNLGVHACSCGYMYTIGECTRPMQQTRCPECGAQIGGREHQLQQGNRRLGDTRNGGWERRVGRPGYSVVSRSGSKGVWETICPDHET
ncbi:rnf213a [Symbiodinium pilosum]|uniref:Rnf213a protein n=1 Tax=Symbiodinium pilosum TaxID=2952 RepID=A0A812KY75_SYMPI|nr:rnf213a [Symbiodinium pilosum]